MTNIEQAIKLSIEGGYGNNLFDTFEYTRMYPTTIDFFDKDGKCHFSSNESSILLDKNFWICLGKSQDWNRWHDFEYDDDGIETIEEWKYHWHSFIDALSRDESIEEFMGRLLDNK